MKAFIPGLAAAFALSACAATPPPPVANVPPAVVPAPVVHTILTTKDIKWTPAPASLPPGAQVALLYGDPGKPEVFVMRLKFREGYVLPPHRHPGTEIVTVISGTFRLGHGEVVDRAKAQPLNAGSFVALSPGMVHYAMADTETVLQLSTTGPWGLVYANPADDPRNKK